MNIVRGSEVLLDIITVVLDVCALKPWVIVMNNSTELHACIV